MASEENLRGPEMKELEASFARLDTTPEAGQPIIQAHSMETEHAEGQSRENSEPIPETQESRDRKLEALRIVLNRMM
ncbi:hypothetical protein PG985_010387 [Apiospora marii]|uniref:uncharacterized protein n=1 Tax=Apiospora marii TaxID=335849 RepID=UPI003131F3E7